MVYMTQNAALLQRRLAITICEASLRTHFLELTREHVYKLLEQFRAVTRGPISDEPCFVQSDGLAAEPYRAVQLLECIHRP
jgi:hypothetical protein